MNIFLTGPVNIGKTSVIQSVLYQLNVEIDGFYTEAFTYKNKVLGFIMKHYKNENEPFIIGLKDSPFSCQPLTEHFDRYGLELLSGISNTSEVVIMDELGILEKDAINYQEEILKILDSKKFVLGVIKNKENSFLNEIRNRPDVMLIDVDMNNRNYLPSIICNYIRAYLNQTEKDQNEF